MFAPRPNLARHSVFALWRWMPLWVWCLIVPLTIVGYVVSATPVSMMLEYWAEKSHIGRNCHESYCYPFRVLAKRSRFINDLSNWEFREIKRWQIRLKRERDAKNGQDEHNRRLAIEREIVQQAEERRALNLDSSTSPNLK